MIGVPGKEQELFHLIEGLRMLSTAESPPDAFQELCENQQTSQLLMTVINLPNPKRSEAQLLTCG